MSPTQSTPSERVQKLLQIIGNLPPFDCPPIRCLGPTTPGQVCGPCHGLETLDALLCTHLEEVDKLLRMRTEVKELLNQAHDRVTHYLPAEITSHIFSLHTENFNSGFDPQDSAIKYGGPLVLAAVSRSWREIAFCMPRLWNTVNIYVPSTNNLPMKVELTKQWLARSQQLPLYISLVYGKWSDQVEPMYNSLVPLFNLIKNVAPRWYKLVLEMPPYLYTTFLGDVICAPVLDTLRLIYNGPFPSQEFHLPHTPLLKHLVVHSSTLISGISLDWGNLTYFESHFVSVDDFFRVLQLSEGLESFRFGFLGPDMGEYPLPATPLTYSSLKALYLNTGRSDFGLPVETLLDLVVLPSLEIFGYLCSDRKLFPNRALPSFFNRSHCQLTHFELSGELQDGTSDDLISILSDMPTITHLKLEDKHSWRPEDPLMSDKLLQRLTPTRPGEVTHIGRLLPRLESLEFLGYKAFSWSCLASLVSSTTTILPIISGSQGSSSSIRRICFRVYFRGEMEFIDTHSVTQFKDARDSGVSVVIVNEEPPDSKPIHLSLTDGPPATCRYLFDLLL